MTDSTSIRWGIVGTGNIASQFVSDLKYAPGALGFAVASRDLSRANDFADRFEIERRYGSYEELATDHDVDVVYVATPHRFHFHNAKLMLEAGKAVLCEKPMTVNRRECEALIEIARANNVFLMEALWTRFFPLIQRLKRLVEDRVIGTIELLEADFGFNAPFAPESRVYNPDLAGGALLDVGIYPVSLALHLFGEPARIQSSASIGQSGVDETTAVTLEFENGPIAQLHCSVRSQTETAARLYGRDGMIHLPMEWYQPREMLVKTENGNERFETSVSGYGYHYEAAHVMECIIAGVTESDIMPLSESLAIVRTLDEIRSQIGLRYPFE